MRRERRHEKSGLPSRLSRNHRVVLLSKTLPRPRMNRTTAPDKTRAPKPRATRAPKPRAEIAAAVFAGALTLFALADAPAHAPAPAAAVIPAERAPAPLRSASYYPEHLAALQSLSGFQPMADAGEKPAEPPVALVAPAKPAPFDPKAPRRAEAKTIVAAPPPGAPGQMAQQAPAPAQGPLKVFGLPLPDVGARVNAQVTGFRDAAGRWGAAAGEKVTSLWR
jgi:hypothetical protein